MSTIRTLIVDDEPRIRRGVERLILSCGEDFEIAAVLSDGKEALEYMHACGGAVDLVISDVKMPEMDGLSFVKEARRHYSFFALFISGYDDFAYLQAALREGAIDYVLKPVDRDQFRLRLGEIREQIHQHSARRFRLGELEQKAGQLKKTRQTQILSYTTSIGVDLSRLGYWVDDFPHGCYQLMYVSLDTPPVKSRSFTAKDWEAYSYVLENIIEELVHQHAAAADASGWCWRGGQSEFWTLLLLPEDEEVASQCWKELAERIRLAITMHTPFTVSIACAGALEDLYLLPDAKRDCLSLIQYRLIEGGNRLFVPQQVTGAVAAEDRQGRMYAAASRLKQAVEQLRLEDAMEQAKLYFAEIEQGSSPEMILREVQNLIIQVHAASMEGNSVIGSAVTLEETFERLRRAAHWQELKQAVLEQVQEAVRGMEQMRSSRKLATPVEQAKTWIKGQLSGDLTIKRIADQVHMNPTYFCECFKNQTGETVLDYITRKRMEAASEKLRDPGLKLTEISQGVGYQDVKYFSRLFKQWAGVTPSQYREQQASHTAISSGKRK